MASSSRDDAYERAELGFELAVLKFGAFWSLWPDMDRFEEDDVAPWWEAGLRYVHEILAAEANAAAPRVASKVHLEAHLYTFLESEGSKVYADKLQPHDVRLWSDPSAAFPSFKIWLTRESRALIDSLVREKATAQQSTTPVKAATPEEIKVARARLKVDVDARVGANIDRLRRERGWSFDDLALQSKVDRKTLMRSGGGKGLRLSTKKQIADAFCVSIADLEK